MVPKLQKRALHPALQGRRLVAEKPFKEAVVEGVLMCRVNDKEEPQAPLF